MGEGFGLEVIIIIVWREVYCESCESCWYTVRLMRGGLRDSVGGTVDLIGVVVFKCMVDAVRWVKAGRGYIIYIVNGSQSSSSSVFDDMG